MSAINVTVPYNMMERVQAAFPAKIDDYSRAIGRSLRTLLPGLLSSSLGRYQTGRLAQSAKAYVSFNEIRVEVGAGLPQAEYVFKGVEPHMMDNTEKGYPMRWAHVGGAGVSMKHMHPGQKARSDIIEEIRALILQVAIQEFVIFELLGA